MSSKPNISLGNSRSNSNNSKPLIIHDQFQPCNNLNKTSSNKSNPIVQVLDLIQTINLIVYNNITLSDSLKINVQTGEPIISGTKTLRVNVPSFILQGKSIFTINQTIINTNFKTNGNRTDIFSNKTHILDGAPKIGSNSSNQLEYYKGIQFLWSFGNGNTRTGFFGFNKSNKRFIYIPEIDSSDNNIFTGVLGDAEFGKIYVTEISSDSDLSIQSVNSEINVQKLLKLCSENMNLTSLKNMTIEAKNVLSFTGEKGVIFKDFVNFLKGFESNEICLFSRGINVSELGQFERDVFVKNILTVTGQISTDKITSSTGQLLLGKTTDNVKINGNVNFDKTVQLGQNSIEKIENGTNMEIDVNEIKRMYIIKSATSDFTIKLPNGPTNESEGLIISLKNLTDKSVTLNGIHISDQPIVLLKGDVANLMALDNDLGSLIWIKI